MKKILFLGGAHHQIRAIQTAKKMNSFTTCLDNIPENPGHRIADAAYPVSTIDLKEVIKITSLQDTDLVYSYGSDVALPTLGRINDFFGLPGPSGYHCDLFSQKNLFRGFLQKHKIQKTNFLDFSKLGSDDINQLEKKVISELTLPVIIKPTDRSGGTGISVCYKESEVGHALAKARNFSLMKNIIVEEFLISRGLQICGDGLIRNGKIKFLGIGNNFFQKNDYHPFAEVFPNIEKVNYRRVVNLMEKIFSEAGFVSGCFNFDVLKLSADTYHVVELTPRLGGNHLSEAINYAYGVDLLKQDLNYLLGREKKFVYLGQKNNKRFVLNIMVKKSYVDSIKTLRKEHKVLNYRLYKGTKWENQYALDNDEFIGCLVLELPTSKKVFECINLLKGDK